MIRAILFAGALALTAPVPSAAQPGPSVLADTFFSTLKAGDAAKAFHDMWAGTVMEKKQAEVENLINQTTAAFKFYGRVVGWDMMSERTFTPNLVERVYMLRTENGPMYVRMLFYRGDTRWIVHSLYLSDRLNEFR